MKVFISWSGELSQQVALALKDWLPSVIQAIEPYVSSEDIDKGARWSTDISKELEDSAFGILCVTRENLDAPWLNFEAGALSKSLERSRVAPLLYRIDRSEVQGPLLQFQSTVVEREDVLKLVRSLNKASAVAALDEARLDDIFEVWWPKLDKKLKGVKAPNTVSRHQQRSAQDLASEILDLVRLQQKKLADPVSLLPPDYVEYVMNRYSRRRAPVNLRAVSALRTATRRFDAILATSETVDTDQLRSMWADVRHPLEYVLDQLGIPSHRRPSPRQGESPDIQDS